MSTHSSLGHAHIPLDFSIPPSMLGYELQNDAKWRASFPDVDPWPIDHWYHTLSVRNGYKVGPLALIVLDAPCRICWRAPQGPQGGQ